MAVTPTDYNAILRDISSAFRNNYRYKILGKADSLFQYTAKLIESDQTKFSLFKSRRIAEQTALNQIENNSALSDIEKQKASAETKIGFLKDAYRTLKSATYDDEIKTADLKQAASYFLKELEQAVQDYIESRGGEASADPDSPDVVDISEEGQAASGGDSLSADDQKFFNDAQKLVNDMSRIMTDVRIRVRAEGIFFDNASYQSTKRVEAIRQLIESVQTPAAAPAAQGGENLDVTV